ATTRPIERFGDIISEPTLGRLHHRYARTFPNRQVAHDAIHYITGTPRDGGKSWHWQSTILHRISKRRRPKAGSASTTGSATNGRCYSRTQRISLRSAPPSSATWP